MNLILKYSVKIPLRLTLERTPGLILVGEMAEYGCPGTADTAPSAFVCPECRTKGVTVGQLTVKALLTESALQQFQPGAHRFCPDPSCDVVYFDAVGRVFMCAHLRVTVWQKESPGRRMICYCFGENEAAIRAEVEHTGRSKAEERVRAHIDAGQCACEVRNPKGACCLGDIAQAVKQVFADG